MTLSETYRIVIMIGKAIMIEVSAIAAIVRLIKTAKVVAAGPRSALIIQTVNHNSFSLGSGGF